jgi:DNA-K related protein/Hsp70 protein
MSSTVNQVSLELDRPPSRYVVGIDLGTTNCAMAYVDTQKPNATVEIFRIPQLVDWGTVEERDTLPSFYYQLTDQEAASVTGPWIQQDSGVRYIVGVLARDRGLQMPGRQIASAKSWLCHSGVDRTASLLPWHGDSDVATLSPVEASSRYLAHLRKAWDRRFPHHLLAEQDIALTLPASFDEVARELTVQAAKLAGLERIVLIEEPQAAFYAWLARHSKDWDRMIHAGESILVCDIGGGTTDFTLIRVKSHEESATKGYEQEAAEKSLVTLHRVAVGQHLILGGDNLDLALAKTVESQLVSGNQQQLPARQWDALRMHCRVAKETLLGNSPPTSYTINLPATGSRLLAQSMSTSVDFPTVRKTLLEGFFPKVELLAKPAQTQTGFQEFGLPYAIEPAVTKHLAAFLWEHRWAGRAAEDSTQMSDTAAARPDWILFNGGVLEASQIQSLLVEQISAWFSDGNANSDKAWKPKILAGNRLDLAVAMGAAYFGLVRRGQGVRIDATLARAYYLVIANDPPKAMCLVPGNAVGGNRFVLDGHPFQLALGQPIQFPLLVSSTQLAIEPGAIVDVDPELMKPMPPIRTVLELPKVRRQQTAQVYLEAELTEIGTLELNCVTVDRAHRWKLDFDVRSTTETDRTAHSGQSEQAGIVEQSTIDAAAEVVRHVFAAEGTLDPKLLFKSLEEATQQSKSDWRPSLLRALWDELLAMDDGRRKSAAHEARWLNTVGYCLRPGYGFAADDWRVATTWRRVQGKLAFRSASSVAEAIILWRRIAGGFTAGQQRALYQDALPRIRAVLGADPKASVQMTNQEATELLRLIGSLELLRAADRVQTGQWCIAALQKKKLEPLHSAIFWVLGRIGTRVPAYGPINQLVSVPKVTEWLSQLIALPCRLSEHRFAIAQMCRMTGDRHLDVDATTRSEVVAWLAANGAHDHQIQSVREVTQLDQNERSQLFGETLPLGLSIPI